MSNRYHWKDTAIGLAVMAVAVGLVLVAAVTGTDLGQLLQKAAASAAILIPLSVVLMLVLAILISPFSPRTRRR